MTDYLQFFRVINIEDGDERLMVSKNLKDSKGLPARGYLVDLPDGDQITVPLYIRKKEDSDNNDALALLVAAAIDRNVCTPGKPKTPIDYTVLSDSVYYKQCKDKGLTDLYIEDDGHKVIIHWGNYVGMCIMDNDGVCFTE